MLVIFWNKFYNKVVTGQYELRIYIIVHNVGNVRKVHKVIAITMQ